MLKINILKNDIKYEVFLIVILVKDGCGGMDLNQRPSAYETDELT